MIYLAAPYTHPDLATRNWRYQRAKQALFALWDAEEAACCPIILGHEYEQRQRTRPGEKPHAFWMLMARAQLSSCTRLYVLTLPGWDTSLGVREEVALAYGMGRPVQGYAPFDHCQDVSGSYILASCGVALRKTKPSVSLPERKEEE